MAAGLALWAATGTAAAQDVELEALPAGPGREEVFYLCGACHSLRLVQQQGLSRERWERLLVWMVEKQGMPEPSADEHQLIIDYLAEHYGPERRAPAAEEAGGWPSTSRPTPGGF